MTKLIERNTTIPTHRDETFTTAADGQTSVQIKVFQGEREIAAHNKMLGEFDLSGIPAAPRGVPKIKVSFDIDANGILSVSARDEGTGKEQKITVTGTSNLNKSEIDRMVQEAAANAEQDRKQREAAERRNQAEQLVYSTERTLADLGDKVGPDEKADIEAKIAAVRSTSEGDDETAFQNALTELQQAQYKLSERIYKEAETQTTSDEPAGANGPAGGADDVIDAEVVDDNK